MLILITGKPGSFKTAKTATLAIQYLKEGRQVYTNIDEFDYDGVQKLPENNDWRDTPDGSVIIYDEAQQFDFLQYKGREKLSTDFLNGVCRHEPKAAADNAIANFLNGVCRHELKIPRLI